MSSSWRQRSTSSVGCEVPSARIAAIVTKRGCSSRSRLAMWVATSSKPSQAPVPSRRSIASYAAATSFQRAMACCVSASGVGSGDIELGHPVAQHFAVGVADDAEDTADLADVADALLHIGLDQVVEHEAVEPIEIAR